MDERLAAAAQAVDMAALGARIRNLRIARGLTQRQLAGDEASTAYVSRIEAGERRPSLSLLSTFARRLEITPDELVSGVPARRHLELGLELEYAELELRTGQAAEALARLDRVLTAGDADDDLVRRARALRGRGLEGIGRLEEAIDVLEDLATTGPAPVGRPGATVNALVEVFIPLSRCYRESGDLGRAIQVGERAREALDEHQLSGTVEGVQLTLTIVAAYFERGDVAHAARLCKRAVEQADALGSDAAKGSAYWNASIVASRRGDQDSAVTFAQRALFHLERCDEARHLARLKTDLGIIHLRSDPPQLEDATELLEAAARDLAFTDASPADRARNAVALAKALVLHGTLDRAHVLLRDAYVSVRDSAPLVAADAQVALGRLAMTRDDVDAARDYYLAAVRHLMAIGADRSAAELWFELAGLLEATDLTTQALDAYRRAAAAAGLRVPQQPSHAASRPSGSA